MASVFVLCTKKSCIHRNNHLPHGYLIKETRGLSESPTFYSQEQGLSFLRGGLQKNFIRPESKKDTEEAIKKSSLPVELTEADLDEDEHLEARSAASAFMTMAMAGGGSLCERTERELTQRHEARERRRAEIRARAQS